MTIANNQITDLEKQLAIVQTQVRLFTARRKHNSLIRIVGSGGLNSASQRP